MDTLSELPEDVLHHILSHVTSKDAIRLGSLSKQLFSSVSQRPSLVFQNSDCRKELDYLLSTLVRYEKENIAVETLKLEVSWFYRCRSVHLQNQCIRLASRRGLKNLSLYLSNYDVVPSPVFEVQTLVHLSLHYCRLDTKSEGRIMWSNLKQLYLERVIFDARFFESLIEGSPLLEVMELNECWFFNDSIIKITNLQNLKQLKARFKTTKTLELGITPNLQSVSCTGNDMELDETDYCRLIFRESQYINLKTLFLEDNVRIDEQSDNFSVDWKSKFPQLEYLSMLGYENMHRIHISSPSLKKIQLGITGRLHEAHFNVPSISSFTFDNKDYCENDIPRVTVSGVSNGWMSHIELKRQRNVNARWFRRLKEFLTAFKGSEKSITVHFNQLIASYAERIPRYSKSVPGGLQEVREFFIKNHEEVFSLLSVRAILHGIFWICHPKTITIQHQFPEIYTEHFYDILVSKSDHMLGYPEFILLSKLWNVTGIEIFQDESHYDSKKGQWLQLPLPSDTAEFLKLLLKQSNIYHVIISFHLEWRTSEVVTRSRKGAKRGC